MSSGKSMSAHSKGEVMPKISKSEVPSKEKDYGRRRTLTRSLAFCSVILAAICITSTALGQAGPASTRLLRFPDISGNSIVFTYAGDLWSVARSGGTARRLTANPGTEDFPKYSPDGRWIAFSGDYDGNRDVYVSPADGGEPRRLTYHPAAERVLGWTPDSKRVLFASSRTSFSPRFEKLFTIGLDGGPVQELPLPAGGLTSFSPDATKIAYNRVSTDRKS